MAAATHNGAATAFAADVNAALLQNVAHLMNILPVTKQRAMEALRGSGNDLTIAINHILGDSPETDEAVAPASPVAAAAANVTPDAVPNEPDPPAPVAIERSSTLVLEGRSSSRKRSRDAVAQVPLRCLLPAPTCTDVVVQDDGPPLLVAFPPSSSAALPSAAQTAAVMEDLEASNSLAILTDTVCDIPPGTRVRVALEGVVGDGVVISKDGMGLERDAGVLPDGCDVEVDEAGHLSARSLSLLTMVHLDDGSFVAVSTDDVVVQETPAVTGPPAPPTAPSAWPTAPAV